MLTRASLLLVRFIIDGDTGKCDRNCVYFNKYLCLLIDKASFSLIGCGQVIVTPCWSLVILT